MARELDEAWVQAAITHYRRSEQWRAEFESWLGAAEVSVRSPDQLVEVRVRPDGSIRQVAVVGPLRGRTNVEVSRSIEAAIGAAATAADWARRTLYAETLRGRAPMPPPLPEQAAADPEVPPVPAGQHQQPPGRREQDARTREDPGNPRTGGR
jgi:hypothetical protein